MNDKTLKIIGFACTVVGFGITIIQQQLEDKKLDALIDKAVEKRLQK